MIGKKTKGRTVICVDTETSIIKARTLMIENKIRHLPVVDKKGRLAGIVSDRDLRMALPVEIYRHPEVEKEDPNATGTRVSAVMTTDPYRISAAYTLQDTLLLFKRTRVGAFPVVDKNDKVIAIISDRDLLHGFIDLLGVGHPGCFLGLIIPPSPRAVSRIVSAVAEENIAISSMLVIKGWEEGNDALFLYLLTQNIHNVKHLTTEMGYRPIEPIQLFFYQHASENTEQ